VWDCRSLGDSVSLVRGAERENLQYLDLMILLGSLAAGLALPVIVGAGFLGAWWSTRELADD
jgi:hypothetical protein